MTLMEMEEAPRLTESEKIHRWRFSVLLRAGADQNTASEISVREEIDLHRSVELLSAGCPADLVLRILWPLP